MKRSNRSGRRTDRLGHGRKENKNSFSGSSDIQTQASTGLIFPQQRKLGVFSHSKGSGAGRSSQIRWEPGSGEGSGEEFPFTGESLGAARSARRKVGNRVPSKRFPSKVPRNRFPSNGS